MNKATAIQVLLLTLGSFVHHSAFAAKPLATPALYGNAGGIDRGKAARTELEIRELSIDVTAVGALAEVNVDATFGYDDEGFSEGVFEMQLPDGAVVTRYALDVDGAMIDGVLVPRGKARVAFEERVRGGVDPGLAEVTLGNVFTTRVFPVDRGGRRIRLSFVAPIDRAHGLVVPLQSAHTVGAAAVKIRVAQTVASPSVEWPAGFPAPSVADAGRTLEARSSDIALTGSLVVQPHDAVEGLIVSSRSEHFQLRVQPPTTRSSQPATAKRLRIYWDRSLSHQGADRPREVAVLEQLIAALHPAAVDLVAFNSSGARSSAVDAAGVAEAIAGVVYRGATSFDGLDRIDLPRADRCVLFSDGVVTIGARASLPQDCRTDAIVATADADLGYLRRIARETGGTVSALAGRNVEDVVRDLLEPRARVTGVWDEAGEPLQFAELADDLVVGEAPRRGGVIVAHTDARGAPHEQRYRVAARSEAFAGAGALWAAARVAELDSIDGATQVAQNLARRHSVATQGMAFLVLETPDDYVAADIAPPSSYSSEWLEEYRLAKEDAEREQQDERRAHLDELTEQWGELKAWWEAGETASLVEPVVAPQSTTVPSLASVAGGENGESIVASAQRGGFSDSQLEEITVTATRSTRDPTAGAAIQIEVEPWSADRPYLRALDAASAEQFPAALVKQEGKHGNLPAFYVDVANWLYTKGRRSEAIEMLLSALELPTRDEQTSVMVASRLLQWGEADRAVALFAKLHEEYSERPQTLRWLALALAETGRRTDLARAAELLTELVLQPWSEQDDGIAMISLLEANRLMARLPAADRLALLDPQLRGSLDVDLRILLDWSTAATDMDLWVEEPTGELASYQNQDTAIRGQLSNDMTDGYGPEQYLLRRAPRGTYTISVDSYAADRINPNGATAVNATLIRNFGRRTQSAEMIQLELAPDVEDTTVVGTFVVGQSF